MYVQRGGAKRYLMDAVKCSATERASVCTANLFGDVQQVTLLFVQQRQRQG